MPTYEYQCTRCSLVFEEFKPISAPRRERCPECRGKVERLISGGMGMLFKGSGFYVTDARGGGKGGDAPGAAKKDGAKADAGTPADKPAAGQDKSGAKSHDT